MATEYVISDRSDGNDYAIKIQDAEFLYEVSVNTPSSEPIIEDDTNAGTYWKVFFDDGEIAIESTLTAQDDTIDITDTVTLTSYRLVILDGQLAFSQVVPVGKRVIVVKHTTVLRATRSAQTRRAIRHQREMRATSTRVKGGGVTINDGLYSITCLQELYKILAMRYK